jgi:hypothetical protein
MFYTHNALTATPTHYTQYPSGTPLPQPPWFYTHYRYGTRYALTATCKVNTCYALTSFPKLHSLPVRLITATPMFFTNYQYALTANPTLYTRYALTETRVSNLDPDGSAFFWELDQVPYLSEKLDPDPH